jgi:actin-related protein 5
MEEFFDDKVLLLKDVKTIPDIVQEYSKDVRGQCLIVDNGSFQCRVGFANKKHPQMIFKNLVCKPRKDRNKKETKEEIQQQAPPATLIGNDIVNIEALRFQLRTQFDKNVVTHFYLQEQIFDYIFTHLGIDTEGQVNHPIVMTEAMVNPNYSRSREYPLN